MLLDLLFEWVEARMDECVISWMELDIDLPWAIVLTLITTQEFIPCLFYGAKISRKNYLFRIYHLFYLGGFKSFQVIFQILPLRKCSTSLPYLPLVSLLLTFPPKNGHLCVCMWVCVCVGGGKWFERVTFLNLYYLRDNKLSLFLSLLNLLIFSLIYYFFIFQ